MAKTSLLLAVLAVFVSTAFLFSCRRSSPDGPVAIKGFVQTQGRRFVVDGEPFRFVGANLAIMYRDDDRARMPETVRQAAQAGMRVVRVWATISACSCV
jgi:hypothetical protein